MAVVGQQDRCVEIVDQHEGPGMVSGVTDHRSAERRADAREEAGVDGSDVVTPLLGELPEQVLLLRGEVRGDVDEDRGR